MKYQIVFARDTAAYASKTVEMPEGLSDAQVMLRARHLPIDLDEVGFEPSEDWTGDRIVCVIDEHGRVVGRRAALAPSMTDLGLVAQMVLSGAARPADLLREAEFQGLEVAPNVRRLLSAPHRTELANFAPFTLYVQVLNADENEECPVAARLDISPQWLSDTIGQASTLASCGVILGRVVASSSAWVGIAPDRVAATDLIIGSPEDAEGVHGQIWLEGERKHAETSWETATVSLTDLAAMATSSRRSAGDGPVQAGSWRWVNPKVLLHTADPSELDDLWADIVMALQV